MQYNWLKAVTSIAFVVMFTLTAEARDVREPRQDNRRDYQEEQYDRRPERPSPPPQQSRPRHEKRQDSQGEQQIQRPVRPSTSEQQSRPRRTDPRAQREYSRTAPSVSRRDHDRHYYKRFPKKRRDHRHYATYYYHTHYLAPIVYYYYPIGFVLNVLPAGYISFTLGGYPYYYYGGVYYRYIDDNYIVVRAPYGGIVYELPDGFIAFELRGKTYYYVNDTYYIWDQYNDYYVVVARPDGAEEAVASETSGRLYVYPKKGQSEEQQAKDRYACHRWAVKQTGIDPVESDKSLSKKDDDNYKRAITACLEGRGYTVK